MNKGSTLFITNPYSDFLVAKTRPKLNFLCKLFVILVSWNCKRFILNQ